MSSAFNHKSRSRVTNRDKSIIFSGFTRRADYKKVIKESRKPSIFKKLSSSFKNLFRKNQGK